MRSSITIAGGLVAILSGAAAPHVSHGAPTSCITPGGTVDDLLAEALAARARGDAAVSLACLSRAYTIEPSAGLLHNIARLLEDVGRYREAAEAYRRIGRSPDLDPALAEADAARLAALLPRLDRAWIRVVASSTTGAANATILVHLDGTPLAPGPTEYPHAPGPAILEVREGPRLDVRRLELAAGRRVDLAIPSATGPARAVIALPAGVRTITIDGSAVATPLDGVGELYVEAGGHGLSWVDASGVEHRRAVNLVPGEPWVLATADEASTVARAVPWIGGAAGLALGGASAVFFGLAEADRRSIVDAQRNDQGHIDGITMAEAERLDARAGDRAVVGAGLLVGAAAALVTAGLVWWLGDAGP